MCPALDTEALKIIQDTAVKAAGVDVKNRICVRETLPDKTKWLLIDKDGGSTMYDVSQPPRQHRLLSVQEVVAFAQLADEDVTRLLSHDDSQESHSPIVWIGADQIIVTLDDRRLFGDRATYQFEPTPEWKLILMLAERADGLDQKSLLRLLRVQLAESFADDQSRLLLISMVRKLRAQQQSTIGNGSGSYDTTLAAGGEIEWPDSVDLSVSVIDDPALTTRSLVRCVIEVEPQPPRFLLTPMAAHIARAERHSRELASDVIREQLKSTQIPVFLGQPE